MNYFSIRLSLFFLLFFLSQFISAESLRLGDGLTFRLKSTSYGDALPIKQWTDNLKGETPENGDIAFTHNQYQFGFRYGRFQFSIMERYDYYIQYNKDTVDFAYALENDLPVDDGRRYHLSLDVNHMRADGFKVGYIFLDTPSSHFSLAASYLRSQELIDGNINGALLSANGGSSADLRVDYNYSDDVLFDREVSGAKGNGYALDLLAYHKISPNLDIALQVEDLYAQIIWDKAPYTSARLNSNSVTVNADGIVSVSPLLSGIEGFRRHKQRLPMRASLALGYDLSSSYRLKGEWLRYDDFDYPALGVEFRLPGTAKLGLSHNVVIDSNAISYQIKRFYFLLEADNLDLNKAKRIGLSVAYNTHL